jgi:hypothetical protein
MSQNGHLMPLAPHLSQHSEHVCLSQRTPPPPPPKDVLKEFLKDDSKEVCVKGNSKCTKCDSSKQQPTLSMGPSGLHSTGLKPMSTLPTNTLNSIHSDVHKVVILESSGGLPVSDSEGKPSVHSATETLQVRRPSDAARQ